MNTNLVGLPLELISAVASCKTPDHVGITVMVVFPNLRLRGLATVPSLTTQPGLKAPSIDETLLSCHKITAARHEGTLELVSQTRRTATIWSTPSCRRQQRDSLSSVQDNGA